MKTSNFIFYSVDFLSRQIIYNSTTFSYKLSYMFILLNTIFFKEPICSDELSKKKKSL